jgi:peptidoglycan/xylan/chitin deacetylase (PgdA/CDA1 family)
VALTFDHGPHSQQTPQVLDTLKTYEAKATFFLTGANALRHPDVISRIRAEGHFVGNYLFSDEYNMLKSEEALEENLLKTEAALTLDGGQKFIRPPRLIFGPAFARVAHRHGYKIACGSAYASDPYRARRAGVDAHCDWRRRPRRERARGQRILRHRRRGKDLRHGRRGEGHGHHHL